MSEFSDNLTILGGVGIVCKFEGYGVGCVNSMVMVELPAVIV